MSPQESLKGMYGKNLNFFNITCYNKNLLIQKFVTLQDTEQKSWLLLPSGCADLLS
jgi:hypothetical protein